MISKLAPAAILISLLARSLLAAFPEPPVKVGQQFTLAGKSYKVTEADILPLVENQYTARFRFDSFDNPKLKDLREKYHFDEVVAGGTTEFDKQVLLLDWVNHTM